MALSKLQRRYKIKRKIRGRVKGTSTVPRLSVYRSNTNIYVQMIDDVTGNTLAQASSATKDKSTKVTKTEQAVLVGKEIAEKAKSLNIESVNFDRSGYLYHGRIKALAEAARKEGLKF